MQADRHQNVPPKEGYAGRRTGVKSIVKVEEPMNRNAPLTVWLSGIKSGVEFLSSVNSAVNP